MFRTCRSIRGAVVAARSEFFSGLHKPTAVPGRLLWASSHPTSTPKLSECPASPLMLGTRPFSEGIDASKLSVQRTHAPKPKVPNSELAFGHVMTDHMLVVDWEADKGWHNPKILPYGPFMLDPASSVLHYALECFEGMKAYKTKDGKVRLFRPDLNMKRFLRSSLRLSLPSFDGDQLLSCIKELIKVDADWIPSERGFSLYVRPTMISTTPVLGVTAPTHAKCFVILSPVGPYFPTGFSAVSLLADERFVRAWPGGTGASKIGGNYAPTIQPQREASKKGFQQILWLYGPEHYVTEVGTMNLFFLWINENGEKELITHPLDDLVLPGVTRQTVLELCRQWGEFKVTERPFTMHEVAKACEESRMIEAFGAGTAAIVCPVKSIHFQGTDYVVPLDPNDPAEQAGQLVKRLMNTIMDIQYGQVENDWSVVIN